MVSDLTDKIMQLIRSEKQGKPDYTESDYGELYLWLDKCKSVFARKREMSFDEVSVDCYIALIPEHNNIKNK